MAKPSEKYSIVPQALRDKFREYKKKERAEDKMEGESEESSSEQDKEALKKLFEESSKGYAKGGMVKSKSRRGDGRCTKGFTKGKVY